MNAGRQRGAALLLVLWLLVLMTALIGSFALSARVESMQGRGLARSVVAAEAARAGLEIAVSRLQDPDPAQRWVADGRTYSWTFGAAEVTIRIVDEAGKFDLNATDVALLAALIRQTGASAAAADALAAAIADWRDADELVRPQGAEHTHYRAAGLAYGPRNAPFESVAEVQGVLGMDAELYARLRPQLTLYSGRVLPDPRFAPPPVLAALGMDVSTALSLRERDNEIGMPASGSGVVAIAATAHLADGRESRVYAVVRAGAAGPGGKAYRVLEWHEGDGWQ